MIKYSQSTQSNKFAILYNISKKKLGMKFIFFHADKYQSFYKLAVSFFMKEMTCPKYRKGALVIFLQFIKKKVSQLLLCSIVMQNIEMFYRSPVMLLLHCLQLNNYMQNQFSINRFSEKLQYSARIRVTPCQLNKGSPGDPLRFC